MLKPSHTPIALIVGSLLSTASFAEETTIIDKSDNDIVISASRVETKRIETGSSIAVLDTQYLQENQARTVAEVLQDIPGVTVTSTGGLGQQTSVYIRGAASNHTLVIIDGIEVNNLTNFDGGYDFAYLTADNIERIEVLKGSQSALWGSDAMGGVINIITKEGKAGFNPTAAIEIGENNYHKENININGATGDSHYSLSASNLKTDGISVTDTDPDDDGYQNKNVTLKAGHQFNGIFAMDAVLRYNDAESEYDTGYYTSRQRQAKLNSNLDLLNKRWKNHLSVAFSDSETEDISSWGSESEGQKIKTDLQSDYYFNTINSYTQRISFVAEHENDRYQSWGMNEKDRIEASGIVGEYGVDWQKTVFVNAALRHDFNSKFDDTTTYHLDISAWVSDGTRLHASHGTGVKNPTLGQLYGYTSWGYNGNAALTAEESRSWDAGVEYNFADVDAYIDLTYFDLLYTDMIEYDSNYTPYNLDDDATIRGVELTGSLRMTEDFRVNAAYTFMETDDGNGDELLRRPKHSASINANYKYTPKLSANIGIRYASERSDTYYDPTTWTSSDVTLNNYTVVNISAAYQIHKHITLSARLENAFDKDYEEVSGYNTDPVTAYVGVSFK